MNLIKVAAAATAALGLGAGVALAEYPERPITLVVSFAAGGCDLHWRDAPLEEFSE